MSGLPRPMSLPDPSGPSEVGCVPCNAPFLGHDGKPAAFCRERVWPNGKRTWRGGIIPPMTHTGDHTFHWPQR